MKTNRGIAEEHTSIYDVEITVGEYKDLTTAYENSIKRNRNFVVFKDMKFTTNEIKNFIVENETV